MMRREQKSSEKHFKYFSLMLFSICFVIFYLTLYTKQMTPTEKELSDNELRDIVIEFDDSSKELELDSSFLEVIRMLDVEEVNQMRNDSMESYVANVTKVQHNLIVAGWRTGSTLTGDILKSYPRSFYHYEPFLFAQQELENINSTVATDVLKNLFLCNFSPLEPFLAFNNDKQWPWSFNTQLWPFCNAFQDFCKNPKFLSSVCRIFPIQVIKTVRVTLNQIASLFDDSELNLKLILLIRDPRGVINSRSKQDWCVQSDSCMNIETLCKRMEADYYEAKRLQKLVDGRVQIIRYEDLVSWPHRTTKAMYEFFGMEMTKEVVDYLNMNTVSQVGRTQPEIAAMLRRHGAFYNHWVTEMEFDEVLEVQKYCGKAMELFGYRVMVDWTEKSTMFETLSDFVF